MVGSGAARCSDRADEAGSPLQHVNQPLERVEADQGGGVGHEVGEGVDVVEVDLAVALALQVLDAANVDTAGLEDREHAVNHPGWRRGRLNLKATQSGSIDRAELEIIR